MTSAASDLKKKNPLGGLGGTPTTTNEGQRWCHSCGRHLSNARPIKGTNLIALANAMCWECTSSLLRNLDDG